MRNVVGVHERRFTNVETATPRSRCLDVNADSLRIADNEVVTRTQGRLGEHSGGVFRILTCQHFAAQERPRHTGLSISGSKVVSCDTDPQ